MKPETLSNMKIRIPVKQNIPVTLEPDRFGCNRLHIQYSSPTVDDINEIVIDQHRILKLHDTTGCAAE